MALPSLVALTFDPTITLGAVLSSGGIIASIIIAAWRVSIKVNQDLSLFRQALSEHAKRLDDHTKRGDKQDAMLLDLFRSLERVMGRMEATSSAVAEAARRT